MWRVPNKTAKVAMASATNSARSPNGGCAIAPGAASARMVDTDDDTALSCNAMYGIIPTIAINATVAATA
jgi:hypothetical protein